MRAAALVVLLTFAAAPSWSEAPTLVVHLTHHPRQKQAADLKAAVETACASPAMKCRVGTALEASTVLYVHVSPVPAHLGLFVGYVEIKSRVMMPGHVRAQAASLERLAGSLLTAVKLRQAERIGVIEVPEGEFGR